MRKRLTGFIIGTLLFTLITGTAALASESNNGASSKAAEETKQGFSAEEIYSILENASAYTHICFKGIMGMATFTDDETVVRGDFKALRTIYDNVHKRFPSLAEDFSEFSIGMSDDYPIAVEYGSTIVRIGSMIFGERTY
jgi:uncharacterized pyridoxal phosphate-containing UPF0001 family protein